MSDTEVMSETEYDNRIRVVRTHDNGRGTMEFSIPKEMRHRYNLEEPAELMLIPEDDSFRVMKLKLEIPQVKKNND